MPNIIWCSSLLRCASTPHPPSPLSLYSSHCFPFSTSFHTIPSPASIYKWWERAFFDHFPSWCPLSTSSYPSLPLSVCPSAYLLLPLLLFIPLFCPLPFRFSICFMLSAYHFSMAMCNLCSICCCSCCSFHIFLYVLHGIYCAAIFHIIFWGSFIVCPFFREYNTGGREGEGGVLGRGTCCPFLIDRHMLLWFMNANEPSNNYNKSRTTTSAAWQQEQQQQTVKQQYV